MIKYLNFKGFDQHSLKGTISVIKKGNTLGKRQTKLILKDLDTYLGGASSLTVGGTQASQMLVDEQVILSPTVLNKCWCKSSPEAYDRLIQYGYPATLSKQAMLTYDLFYIENGGFGAGSLTWSYLEAKGFKEITLGDNNQFIYVRVSK